MFSPFNSNNPESSPQEENNTTNNRFKLNTSLSPSIYRSRPLHIMSRNSSNLSEEMNGVFSEHTSSETINNNTASKGKACDNCRAKKIKCNFGDPCDQCLKRQMKIKKRMEKSGVSIPLLKCTYAYEISTVKKNLQSADKRVSEKQILEMVKNKLDCLNKVLIDETAFSETNVTNGNLKSIPNLYKPLIKSKFSPHLKDLLEIGKEEIKKKENNNTLRIYSKLIETEVGNRNLLRQIKNEDHYCPKEPVKKIGKRKPNKEKLKSLGNSLLKNSTKCTANTILDKEFNNRNTNKQSNKVYLDQEKESFKSSFLATHPPAENGSLKSRLTDMTSPLMLKNLLKTTEAFQNISPVLSKIKYLTDLLKTDSEIYLQKLFKTMGKPFYLDIPPHVIDYLIEVYLDNNKIWFNFMFMKDMKDFAEQFRSDQKSIDETEIFLMNTVLLLSCQIGKGVIYCPKKKPKGIDQDTLIIWENIILLNCISFYHKFLIFPSPSLDEGTDLNALFKSTMRKLQSLLLLGYYFSNSPAPRLFVHLFSIIITVSQDFHFDNLNFFGDRITMELKVQARNLWLSSFIAEKHISVTFGKPEFILGFDDNVLGDEIFINSLITHDPSFDDNIRIDYSHENTSWIKFLRRIPLGNMYVGFFLRLELLKIETVYYKTLVACENEYAKKEVMIKKCDFILKAFEEFEIKAKKFLEINTEESVDIWIKKISKKTKGKQVCQLISHLFLTLNTLKLNTFIFMLDLQYKQKFEKNYDLKEIIDCEFQVEVHNMASAQLSLLDFMFEHSWPARVGSEVIISFITALAPFFYNSVLDKGYLKLNLKRMVNMIKKFASIGLSENFYDPLKWNTATLHSIFYMKILYLCHPDVFMKVFESDFSNMFITEYTGAFNCIKEFKSKMTKHIETATQSISKLPANMRIGLSDQSSWNPARQTSSISSSLSANPLNYLHRDLYDKRNSIDSVNSNYVLPKIFSNVSTPRAGSLNGISNINTPLGLFAKDNLHSDFDFQEKLMDLLDPNCVCDFLEDDLMFGDKNNSQKKKDVQYPIQTPNGAGSRNVFKQSNNKNVSQQDKRFLFSNIEDEFESLINQNFFGANTFKPDAYTEDDLFFKNE
ncbi:hypothetical protein HANVADRAFT_65422 [Hanseniaspora valbyensis NRRL Y-1626]|uniref:Zn(2)-C6 fungal-type domain-containing protein n=1 Tax=Hanseniaspora valbyensis NRRL Y-1626 TaxID=766949 RepID=A0A1B7TJW0_9ASCO|nr:hypothetical protein HANVADRAFT_65422 [Hanseniaspora valbyensis NRRL Y-1626]